MLNAAAKYNPNDIGTFLVYPSSMHFSLIFNKLYALTITMILLAIGIVASGISGGIIGATLSIIFVATFVILLVKMCFAYKISAYYYDDIADIEKAFNEMSKANRKKYAEYLKAMYKDYDNHRLLESMQKLFNELSEDSKIHVPSVQQRVDKELKSIREINSLAKDIYNQSMGQND